MCKLAICVATVGKIQAVEEVLKYSIGYLNQYDVDIYYYDSGRGKEIKELIERIKSEGYGNIYHIPVDFNFSYGEKIDLIYSGYGLVKDYEYIWPIKDRVICNELMLKLVLKRCERRADIIVSLSLGEIFESDSIDITSPVELYSVFAKQTTSLETVIYNRHTMLRGYRFGESKNAPKHQNDFWHYHFIYNNLAKMENPIIGIVSKDGAYNMRSSVPQESGWINRALEVWIDEWVRINFELPDIYTPYKAKAIKDTTSLDELLGNMDIFIKLHEQGILNKETYNRYEDMWEFVTPISKDEIRRIALDY